MDRPPSNNFRGIHFKVVDSRNQVKSKTKSLTAVSVPVANIAWAFALPRPSYVEKPPAKFPTFD